MNRTMSRTTRPFLVIIAAAALLPGCAGEAPLAPDQRPASEAQFAKLPPTPANDAIATLRRVTARYHDIDVAFADGFVLLHPCEDRPGEGPVGSVYVHFGRLLDGIIDPETPDALIYEPTRNGHERLVGAEFAIPYGLWSGQSPPEFLGAVFQPENEFGVWALHVWIWRNNPEGLFAEANPHVSCGAE
jgi:hypothetical protein